MLNLAQMSAYWARFRGDEDAVICGDTRYSWVQFDAAARSVAQGLQAAGVVPGDRVGLLLTSSAEWAVIFAAISMAGGVIVPLNPRFGRFELRAIENDAECRVLVTTPSTGAELSDRFDLGGDEEVVIAKRTGAGGPHALRDILTLKASQTLPDIAPDALAAIFYTSGTTGTPKGTMHTHATIGACVFGQMLGLGFASTDRALIMAPLAFTGACLSLLAPMLLVGGCAVIEPVFDPARMLHLIERERITFITNVPAIWERLPAMPQFRDADFSSLRIALTGGAPVAVSLLEAFRCKNIVIRQCYGATEGGGMLSYPTTAVAFSDPASAGWPQSTVALKIMQPDGQECPLDAVGEIWIKGPQVMTGYWRNPQADTQAFSDGWYKTGDLGAMNAEGRVMIMDRLKNMIISGGVNIYPAEIERAMSAIDGVDEVGVFGQADEKWGERVVALIHSARSVAVEAVRSEARRLLGDFKTPREIIVSPTPLPRTVTNKIARKDLPALYESLKARGAR